LDKSTFHVCTLKLMMLIETHCYYRSQIALLITTIVDYFTLQSE